MANVSCVECGGEYRKTDEQGVFECRDCGQILNQVEFIEDTAAVVREYDGLEDIADWLNDEAKRLGAKNG